MKITEILTEATHPEQLQDARVDNRIEQNNLSDPGDSFTAAINVLGGKPEYSNLRKALYQTMRNYYRDYNENSAFGFSDTNDLKPRVGEILNYFPANHPLHSVLYYLNNVRKLIVDNFYNQDYATRGYRYWMESKKKSYRDIYYLMRDIYQDYKDQADAQEKEKLDKEKAIELDKKAKEEAKELAKKKKEEALKKKEDAEKFGPIRRSVIDNLTAAKNVLRNDPKFALIDKAITTSMDNYVQGHDNNYKVQTREKTVNSRLPTNHPLHSAIEYLLNARNLIDSLPTKDGKDRSFDEIFKLISDINQAWEYGTLGNKVDDRKLPMSTSPASVKNTPAPVVQQNKPIANTPAPVRPTPIPPPVFRDTSTRSVDGGISSPNTSFNNAKYIYSPSAEKPGLASRALNALGLRKKR